ncbi:hypothetical protein DOY81_012138, partial [Sarcophaga bullata]
RGIYVIGFSFPCCAQRQGSSSCSNFSCSSTDDIQHAVSAFTEVGKSLKVIQ